MSKIPTRQYQSSNAPPADVRSAALSYGTRGWAVIPMEPRGKRPLVPWLEFQQRHATTSEIESWLQRWPDANVGLVTGRVSGLVVLDIDPRHSGLDSLSLLEVEYGPLPTTIRALTGGDGRHLYFAHPGPAVANRVAARPGIDVRADGGCVVAPPSMHPSGRRYAWAAGCAPDQVTLAPLPDWLRDLLQAAGQPRHTPAYWRNLVSEGVAEGQRNSTLASLTGHLLWRGIDPEVTLELMLAWNQSRCRPPLPDEDVAQVVRSIGRMHVQKRDS